MPPLLPLLVGVRDLTIRRSHRFSNHKFPGGYSSEFGGEPCSIHFDWVLALSPGTRTSHTAALCLAVSLFTQGTRSLSFKQTFAVCVNIFRHLEFLRPCRYFSFLILRYPEFMLFAVNTAFSALCFSGACGCCRGCASQPFAEPFGVAGRARHQNCALSERKSTSDKQ